LRLARRLRAAARGFACAHRRARRPGYAGDEHAAMSTGRPFVNRRSIMIGSISGSQASGASSIPSGTPGTPGPDATPTPSGSKIPGNPLLNQLKGKHGDKPPTLEDTLKKARDTREPLSLANYTAGHVHPHDTPGVPGAQGRFYHEVQRTDSGTCAIHAINAYSGSSKYNVDHFALEQSKEFGFDHDMSRQFALQDGNDARFVRAVLNTAEQDANTVEMGKSKTELAARLEQVDTHIDRVMVGLAGQGENGHWVAFRKDANQQWHKLDSYPGGINKNDPQPRQTPADFLKARAGTGSDYSIVYR
jgi:hypothetical protein